jgi:hypothetical protein
MAGGGDLGDDRADLVDAGDHLLHGGAGLLDHLAAHVHLLGGVVDQRLDLLGGDRAALGQAAHLGGHDREAAALLAGPAASTAAFSARMLVWKAMPSMTPMISTMRLDEVEIEFMVLTT